MGLIIRQATPDDVPQLVHLGMQFTNNTNIGRWVGATPDRIENVALPIIFELGCCFVAERDGRLVGMLATVAAQAYFSPDKVCEELAWWVDEDARNGTVGFRLLTKTQEWCSQNGVDVLQMSAPFGSPVIGFLERLGFEALEVKLVWRFPRMDVVLQQPSGSSNRASDRSGQDDVHGDVRRDLAHRDGPDKHESSSDGGHSGSH